MRAQKGFTLIEVMVVVAIIALLSAIAVPMYTDYIRRARITDAVSQLSGMRVKMEQYFQDNRTYVGACAAGTVATLPATVAADPFSFTCPVLTATTYSIVATGQGSMLNFIYAIDQRNTRTTTSLPTGWTVGTCGWVLKKDGSC